jgi:hypothetical protein
MVQQGTRMTRGFKSFCFGFHGGEKVVDYPWEGNREFTLKGYSTARIGQTFSAFPTPKATNTFCISALAARWVGCFLVLST